LYIRRQAANFIVTQSQLSQAMQSEEILQARRREKKKTRLNSDTFFSLSGSDVGRGSVLWSKLCFVRAKFAVKKMFMF